MGNTCRSNWYGTGRYHSVKAPHDYYFRVFYEGDYQLDPFTLKPGEDVDIVVEFDFSNPQVSNDWSVTLWAPDGPVSVRYKDNRYESDHFPLLGNNPNTDNTDGTDGTDGNNNTDGNNGTDGNNNTDGNDGTDGNNNTDGTGGNGGNDGTDGTDGTDGNNNTDGNGGGGDTNIIDELSP